MFKTNQMDVASVSSNCSILEEGGTADPAMWTEWLDSIEKAMDNKDWEIARFQPNSRTIIHYSICST